MNSFLEQLTLNEVNHICISNVEEILKKEEEKLCEKEERVVDEITRMMSESLRHKAIFELGVKIILSLVIDQTIENNKSQEDALDFIKDVFQKGLEDNFDIIKKYEKERR
jgi:hypothetical protein